MIRLKRGSGILMPVFSLPSSYGIGTFGKAAYDFLDFLSSAKQSYWQMLPLGPTGFGDSPYASFSSFAGNPYFIDLDLLIENSLLDRSDVSGNWGGDASSVDYAVLYKKRLGVLRKAVWNGLKKDVEAFHAFEKNESSWLSDYALFMACKDYFGGTSWDNWPDKNLRFHTPEAVKKYGALLKKEVLEYKYIQYLFFKQWQDLKTYAENKGIKIIGDIPIYVAYDSADVWSEPEWFILDEERRPKMVAGVPPDAFTCEGQLWGNPLYDWEKMHLDNYGWWIRRIGGARKLCDILRIDHFRGIESYWAVKAGSKNAVNGKWEKGPGLDFIKRITDWFSDMGFIAEDLGYLTPKVRSLVKDSGLPGMKILQFAFDFEGSGDYLPHNYISNCVCYTGTHDNETLAGWLQNSDSKYIDAAKKYLGLNKDEGFIHGIIRGGMSSVADLFVTEMQDYLELGNEARINTPGTAQGNWTWRMEKSALSEKLALGIAEMTAMYGRE